jgi:hypothetical protein
MSCDKSQIIEGPCLFLSLKAEDNLMADERSGEQKEIFRAHLAMAVFCEKVLREVDNVLSVIRIIDRFNVVGATPEMIPTVLQFTILVSFKSGFLRGKQLLAIRPKSPNKEDLPQMAFPILFEGDDDRGNALVAQINFVATQEGLYWFDVHLNDESVTRMPLRVAYQQAGSATVQG